MTGALPTTEEFEGVRLGHTAGHCFGGTGMQLRVTSRLKASLESDVAQREEVSDSDVHLSRLSGMAPADIDVLCDFTRQEGLFVAVRCPKRPARYFHGKVPPKPAGVDRKSDPATGLILLDNGCVFVSDYDLMCVWRHLGRRDYRKVFFSAPDPALPTVLTSQAQALMDKLDGRLKSAFQHGAQDDYKSARHPNVQVRSEHGRLIDRFMVFNLGQAEYVATATALSGIYERHLGAGTWPYDVSGRHLPSAT